MALCARFNQKNQVPLIIFPPVDTFNWTTARDANLNVDQSLRRTDGTFISNTPFIAPYDSVLYAITAENDTTITVPTWDLVVEVNGVVQATLTKTTGQFHVEGAINVSLSQGDRVVLFFRNASATISRPGGGVYGRAL